MSDKKEDVAQEEEFIKVDPVFLESVIKLVDAMAQRGSIRGDELLYIGGVRQYAQDRIDGK